MLLLQVLPKPVKKRESSRIVAVSQHSLGSDGASSLMKLWNAKRHECHMTSCSERLCDSSWVAEILKICALSNSASM